MSAPSEAERLWRQAQQATCENPDILLWPVKHTREEICIEGHAAIDAAVRAAFEEGHRIGIQFADTEQKRPWHPPWLPGAKEDK